MAESLASRVGRIVSGSVNALVDAVENAAPAVVMEEAIREVDRAVEDVRAELGKVLARRHLATTRLMEENRRHEELAHRIELALGEGRDDLAEAAIAKQLDIEAQIPVIERTVTECTEQEGDLEGFIAALLARRREMEDELAEFRTASDAAASTGSDAPSGSAGSTAGHRAELATSAFDRVLSRNAGMPGVKEGLDTEKKLAELDKLARENRVRERLAAAKARMES
ncbi:MAG: PspA/IM30 family protein [Myxococcota bacterium]|nr:PspA/IM30 family protein [Myxococcota bacterium]